MNLFSFKKNRKRRGRKNSFSRRSVLAIELLEPRVLLANDYQNAFLKFDVNDDGFVAPLDVLLVINQIIRTGIGPLSALAPDQRPTSFVDVTGNGALEPLDILQVINELNLRDGEPVNATFVSPNVLQTQRSVTESNKPAIVQVSMANQSFTVAGPETFVRFIVSSASSSSLDPGAITVRKSTGEIVIPRLSANNTAFSTSSFTIVPLSLGKYTLEVVGQGGTTGAFVIAISIVGDIDGNGSVTDVDRKQIGAHRQFRTYDVQGDADLNGRLTAEDYNLGRANTGDGTSLIATQPTIGESTDDTIKTDRKTIFSGSGATSVLANDDERNPFPVELKVVSFQNKSELGADVLVNPDGTFTYDPRNLTQLANIKRGQVEIDRFTYKTSGIDESTVNVIIEGVREGTDDSYDGDEDNILQIGAALGLLSNDPGTGSTISTFDSTSNLGAKVVVNPDGSFTYDPTNAITLQQLQAGDSLFDYFNYQSVNGVSQVITSVVSIKVDGKNDLPLPKLDLFSTTQENTLISGNVLSNDSDVDSVLPTNANAVSKLRVTQSTTVTSIGAMVTIAADGKLSYDARSVAAVGKLSRDEVIADTFEYTVSDGVASATGKVTVLIVGLQHPVVATNDAFEVVYPHSKFIAADKGVLANDSDLDVNDTLTIVSYDATGIRGGTVTIFEDGSLLYSSGSGFFDAAKGVPLLKDGEIGIDTFTYTVSDGHGSQKTATVQFMVTGAKNSFDDEYVTNASELLSVPANLGLFINEPFKNPRIVTSPAESKQRAKVVVNPSDGSFTYDARNLLTLVPDTEGIAYDSFSYTTRDANNPGATVTSVANIKVFTKPNGVVSAGNNPSFNPSVSTTIDQRVLKIVTLKSSEFGGEIAVQAIDVQGFDAQGAALLPRVRIVAMHTATIPATPSDPPKTITQRIVVGDFDSDAFDSIDFQGTDGKDILFITLANPYPVTGRGLGGDDWLQGGNGIATFEGGDGNDTLLAGGLASTLKGGNGNDEIVGGPGNDTMEGGEGNDDLFGGDGNDILIGGNGNDYLRGGGGADRMVGGSGADRFEDYSGPNEPSLLVNANRSEGDRYALGTTVPSTSIVTGIKTQAQTSDDLKTNIGVLVVSIPNVVENPGSATSGPVLIINGPTAYGYTLKGNWSISKDGLGNETFTNTGPLTIVTGFGDVTIPTIDSAKVRFTTTADAFDGVGVLNTSFNLKDFLVSLFSGTTASSSFENQLKDIAGIELNLPQQLEFGFDLGYKIRQLNGFSAVPLADPLPYFYFRYAMGANLVTLGNNSLSSSFGTEVIVAFDPLDPMLYAFIAPPVGGIAVGFAGSKNGYIPFRAANAIPSYYTSLGLGSSTFFGHIYLQGSIDISEFVPEIPLTVSGNLVLDLDSKDDGSIFRNVRNLADEILLTVKNPSRNNNAMKSAFGDILGDLAVGINGQVDLVAPLPGKLLNLTVPLGGGTFIAKNKTLAFSGSTAQPFENVPFLKGLKVAQSNIQGFYNVADSKFAVDYSLQSPEFYGVKLNSNEQTFHISNNGARLSGSVSTPLGLTVNVAGRLNFNSGEFLLTGDVNYSIDLKLFKPSLTLHVTLSNFGSLGYGLYFNGSFTTKFESFAADATFNLTLAFTAAQNGFSIGGSGSVAVDGPGSLDFTVRAALSDSGFSVDLGLLGKLTVTWR